MQQQCHLAPIITYQLWIHSTAKKIKTYFFPLQFLFFSSSSFLLQGENISQLDHTMYTAHVYHVHCTCIPCTVYMYTMYCVHVYNVLCTCIQCTLYIIYVHICIPVHNTIHYNNHTRVYFMRSTWSRIHPPTLTTALRTTVCHYYYDITTFLCLLYSDIVAS